MTSKRFDGVIRSLDAARSRRVAVTALLGGLSGLFLFDDPDATSAKRKKGRRNRRRRKDRQSNNGPCGNGDKEGKDCRCKKQGEACADDASCCPRTKGLSCQDGTCQPCDVCLSGCEFSSVQAAITAAADGATIHICAGVFAEGIDIFKDITLIGVGSGKDGTVLDGQRNGPTVGLTDATVTLERLLITGGATSGTGGGIFSQSSTLTLTDCTVSGNTADERGGGIGVIVGSVTLNGSRVTDNRSSGLGGGIAKLNASLTLISSVVSDNEAEGDGGGIFHEGGATRFEGSTIRRNEAGSRGGGIYFNSGAMTLFEGSLVEENTAGIEGGGIFRVTGAITLFDSTVTDNEPDNCQGNVGNCTNP